MTTNCTYQDFELKNLVVLKEDACIIKGMVAKLESILKVKVVLELGDKAVQVSLLAVHSIYSLSFKV